MKFDVLTREEVRACADAAVAVVPCGAIEQHGPHLAVGADSIFVDEICRAAADVAAPHATVLVVPPVSFGISDHHKPHPGVLSLRPTTFISLLGDLGACLVESGFRRIVFVNGHNGNEDAIKLVARDLNNSHDASFAATSYWTAAWSELEESGVVDAVPRIPGHAGKFETSMMLKIDAALVRHEQLPATLQAPANARQSVKPSVFPRRGNHGFGPGYSDAPKEASGALGQRAFDACVCGLAKFFVEFATPKRGT